MSKLSEYLALIPKALGNPKQVIEGWVNVVRMEFNNLPDDEVEEIVRRRIICGSCEYMSKNVDNLESKREEPFCTLCNCPIISKSSSLSSVCGAKWWNDNNLNEIPKEIKWLPYDKETANTGIV